MRSNLKEFQTCQADAGNIYSSSDKRLSKPAGDLEVTFLCNILEFYILNQMLFHRVPDPPRREGQCPFDIELLLRDYSRARAEARAEIARARDRLRERTEQEKRRLQQQALSQAVKVSDT